MAELTAREIGNCWDASLFKGRRNIVNKTSLPGDLSPSGVDLIITQRFSDLTIRNRKLISEAIKEQGNCMFE